MSEQTGIYNGFFKAKDRFLSAHYEPGYEPDVISDYIHWGLLISSLHEKRSENKSTLLCELFLRQLYMDMLNAISNPKHTLVFRKICLDSVHIPLMALKRYYFSFEQGQGEEEYLRLKHQLRFVQTPLE